VDGGLEAARTRVPLDHAEIADHDGAASLAHRRIERGLEADLRADARGVARGDGDFRSVAHDLGAPVPGLGCVGCGRYCQGISEA
jgi:hypothetical protein